MYIYHCGQRRPQFYEKNMKDQQELHLNKPRDATPKEIAEWAENDFFMKGDFDVMKLFVAVPAVIQFLCLTMMFAVMALNSVYF